MNVLTRRGITQTKSDRTQCVLFPFSEVEIRLHLNIRLKCSKAYLLFQTKTDKGRCPFPFLLTVRWRQPVRVSEEM